MNLSHYMVWAAAHVHDADEAVSFAAWIEQQERTDPAVSDVGYSALLRVYRGEAPPSRMEMQWDGQALEPVKRY